MTTLDAFSDESEDSDSSSERTRSRSIGAATARRGSVTDAPDRDGLPSWGPTKREDSVEVRQLIRSTHINGYEASPYEFRWVVGGHIKDYCTSNGTEQIPIPSAYSKFDKFDPYIAQVGTIEDAYGLGIGANRLEAALRLLTGGGRFNASKYNLLACGDKPAVLAGPEGTLLVGLGPVRYPGTPASPKETEDLDIGDRTISCSAPIRSKVVREGLVRLLHQLDRTDRTCVHVSEGTGDSYAIEQADEDRRDLTIDATPLAQIGRLYHDPEDVPYHSGATVTDPNGTEHMLEWVPALTPDETIDGGPVLGYSIATHQPAELNEWVVEVQTHYLVSRLTSLEIKSVAEPVLRTAYSRATDR